MKKLTILCLLCLASMGAMAKSLVLTLSDGTLVYYLLGGETDPRMRFVEGKIEVNTDVYEISGIKNFYAVLAISIFIVSCKKHNSHPTVSI